VYDYAGAGFDAAYFSASFMILPDPVGALEHVRTCLAPGGRVFFTQTFQDRPSPLVERMKPLLRTLTTVEFGQVTYEQDFLDTLRSARMRVVEHKTLTAKRSMSYRLVVAEPAEA
jgi:SAM-dependent methyltransferase